MARDEVTLEGLGELTMALNLAIKETRAAAAAAVLQETHEIRDDAEAGAPRDTGELATEISTEIVGSSGTWGQVRATSDHALPMEYGTFKDTAQSFMHPAAERGRGRFTARATALLKTALEALAR